MRIIVEEDRASWKREDGCTCPVEAEPGASVLRRESVDTCPTHRIECRACAYDTPIGGDCGFRYCPRYEEHMARDAEKLSTPITPAKLIKAIPIKKGARHAKP